jgi:hypothetical protein
MQNKREDAAKKVTQLIQRAAKPRPRPTPAAPQLTIVVLGNHNRVACPCSGAVTQAGVWG